MTIVLVLGATGKQGSAVARALIQHGHIVHALVRDPGSDAAKSLETLGVRPFKGTWDEASELRHAVDGAEAIFFASMPSFADKDAEVRWSTNIVEVARQTPSVQQIIYSTVAGMDVYDQIERWDQNPFLKDYYLWKSKGEELVRSSGIRHWTIVRPVEFMSNFLVPSARFQFPDLISTGVWNTLFPDDFVMDLIDTNDIGRIVAKIVKDPQKYSGLEMELAGDSIPLDRMMALLAESSGKPLRSQQLSKQKGGEAALQNPIMQGQYMRLARSKLDHESPQVEDLGGSLQTFKAFLSKNRQLVIETYEAVPQVS